jgi:IclR family acetate operon transcriptional repressor
MGGHKNPIATLSVNIPISRLTQESEVDFGAAVSAAASSLSARLG